MKSRKTKSELLENLDKVLEEEQKLKAKMVAHLQEMEDSLYFTKEQIEYRDYLHLKIVKVAQTKKLIDRLLEKENHVS